VPDEISWEGALIPSAVKAVQEGYSANAFLRALGDLGHGVRRSFGLRVFGEAKALAAEYSEAPTRDMNTVPRWEDTRAWPTRATSGLLQNVKLYYREHVTGRIIETYYSVKSEGGITPQEAVNKAIDAYESSAPSNAGGSRPVQADFIGAIPTGVARLTPQAVA
jgi:hypothetical protein